MWNLGKFWLRRRDGAVCTDVIFSQDAWWLAVFQKTVMHILMRPQSIGFIKLPKTKLWSSAVRKWRKFVFRYATSYFLCIPATVLRASSQQHRSKACCESLHPQQDFLPSSSSPHLILLRKHCVLCVHFLQPLDPECRRTETDQFHNKATPSISHTVTSDNTNCILWDSNHQLSSR